MDLVNLPPAALHRLECATADLRHSTGMKQLSAFKTLAQLAPARMGKPGFCEKLEQARATVAAARVETEDFFRTRVTSDHTVGELFVKESACVTRALSALEDGDLSGVPDAVDGILGALTAIGAVTQAARQRFAGFVHEQTARLGNLCDAQGVHFVQCVALDDDVTLFFDPTRLGTALTELVTNALKHAFGEKGGALRLEVRPGDSPNDVLLAVSDDGRGIPRLMRARLFERGATTGGSGEGLALVKEVVEDEHLGELSFESDSDGTRWQIRLPVRAPRERLKGVPVPAATPAGHATRPDRPHGEAVARAPGERRGVRAISILFIVALAAAGIWAVVYKGEPDARPTGPRKTPGEARDAPERHPGPGRAPQGFAAVGESGRDPSTGWANEIVHEKTGIPLVFVPATAFDMGADDGDTNEGPAHRVTISRPLYIGKREVTQTQYENVIHADPSRVKGAQRPVEQVSYVDALGFCGAAGMRLPTEAEWELAARQASEAEAFLDGVAEWCSDWYALYEDGPAVDPKGPHRGERRVVRGGSFLGDPELLRATQRTSLAPGGRHDFVGFRVVADAQ